MNQPAATLKDCRVVWDEAGDIKPSCNFHFGYLKQVDNINFGGCLWKFSKNLRYEKKNLNETEKFFLKNQFFANFSKQIVFFYVKFAFRMFSAFIWYTYCPCRSKMTNFQKLWYRKLENFRGQSRLLRRHLTAKLCNLEWCSKTLQADKDASFHLRWCLGWFAWKLTIQEHENHYGTVLNLTRNVSMRTKFCQIVVKWEVI